MTEEERNLYMYYEKYVKRSCKQYSEEVNFGTSFFW